MSKKRSDGQVLVAFALDENLAAEVDAKRGALSRSAFIRVALARLLGKSDDVARPPERLGLSKGGKPTHKTAPKEESIASTASIAAMGDAPKAKRKAAG